jgi:hypothetical protein
VKHQSFPSTLLFLFYSFEKINFQNKSGAQISIGKTKQKIEKKRIIKKVTTNWASPGQQPSSTPHPLPSSPFSFFSFHWMTGGPRLSSPTFPPTSLREPGHDLHSLPLSPS